MKRNSCFHSCCEFPRFEQREKFAITITSHSPKVYRLNTVSLPRKTCCSQGYFLSYPEPEPEQHEVPLRTPQATAAVSATAAAIDRKTSAYYLNKRFDNVRDFTRNTAMSGLSSGEKFIFWLFNRISVWSKNWFTHLFLLLILIIYSLFGACMFQFFEGNHERLQLEQVDKNRQNFLNELRLLLKVNLLRKGASKDGDVAENDEWYTLSMNLLKKYDEQQHQQQQQFKTIDLASDSITNKTPTMTATATTASATKTWTLWNSLFFCGTVYTTIGYGHIYPITTTGKALTIVYAIFGIPLFLIILTDFGKLFTRGIKFCWAFVRRLYYTGSCRRVRRQSQIQDVMKNMKHYYVQIRKHSNPKYESGGNDTTGADVTAHDKESPQFEINDEFNLPISVAFLVLVAYILCGAFIYSSLENWTFFEAFYFVFISMSTIGFGDYVPQHPMYMIASIAYLIFGLALTSMFINVVQLRLTEAFQQASAKLSSTMGFNSAADATAAAAADDDMCDGNEPDTETSN